MSFLDTVKNILGIKPVPIGELNTRATRATLREVPSTAPKGAVEEIHIPEEYLTVESLICDGWPVVFVTGSAGTGKSVLIDYLRAMLDDMRLVVVAPTGVAALNVGGVTIHSFFKLPPWIHSEEDIKLVYDRKLYEKLDLLIVDEVSMVRCDLMDSIDKFLRKNRSSDMPFGGVQLLLIGDLFQLPPVATRKEMTALEVMGYTSTYFFSAFALQKSALIPVEFTSVYRQKDQAFISLLKSLRLAKEVDSAIAEINSRCYRPEDISADITLTSTNNRADQINMNELQHIPEREYAFKGEFKGRFSLEEDKLPSPLDLRLKVGARVMFTKNDDRGRWVNGTLGIVRNIDQESIGVELVTDHKGSNYDVQQVTWETHKYTYSPEKDQILAEKVGEYTQYPLMLAWAVTIHKSQGKTLDRVLVDLGDGAFAPGQVYVALSRCRSLESIRLARPVRTSDVKCDPLIKRFYLEMDEMKMATGDN